MAAYQCLNCGMIEQPGPDCCAQPDLFCINDMPDEIKRLRKELEAMLSAAPAPAPAQQPKETDTTEWVARSADLLARFIHLSATPDNQAWTEVAILASRLLNEQVAKD